MFVQRKTLHRNSLRRPAFLGTFQAHWCCMVRIRTIQMLRTFVIILKVPNDLKLVQKNWVYSSLYQSSICVRCWRGARNKNCGCTTGVRSTCEVLNTLTKRKICSNQIFHAHSKQFTATSIHTSKVIWTSVGKTSPMKILALKYCSSLGGHIFAGATRGASTDLVRACNHVQYFLPRPLLNRRWVSSP